MDIIRVLQEYWPSFCKALMITLEMTVFSLIFATTVSYTHLTLPTTERV